MKVALTGGASGIGAAVAHKLIDAGHHVTAFDISQPDARVSAWIKTDLNDPVSISNALTAAEGPYDVLINNAGVPPRVGQAELVLSVNWFGLCEFLDGMLNKLADRASIVNTASRAGAMWRDNLDEVKALMACARTDLTTFIETHSIDATRAYNLSKEAVIVMTMTRAADMVARGFRMNSVSPAAVSTEILDDFVAAFGDKVARNVALAGRPGTAEEIADVIVFLASPQSHWIKGQDIVIDGGMSAMNAGEMLGI